MHFYVYIYIYILSFKNEKFVISRRFSILTGLFPLFDVFNIDFIYFKLKMDNIKNNIKILKIKFEFVIYKCNKSFFFFFENMKSIC